MDFCVVLKFFGRIFSFAIFFSDVTAVMHHDCANSASLSKCAQLRRSKTSFSTSFSTQLLKNSCGSKIELWKFRLFQIPVCVRRNIRAKIARKTACKNGNHFDDRAMRCYSSPPCLATRHDKI